MFFFEKIVDWNEEWLLDGVLLCCTWKLCIMYYVNMRDNILQGILTTKLENQINFLWRLIYNKSSSTFIIQSLGKMNYIARKSFIELADESIPRIQFERTPVVKYLHIVDGWTTSKVRNQL